MKSKALTTAGLLLILAAVLLTLWNIWEGYRVTQVTARTRKKVEQAVAVKRAQITPQAGSEGCLPEPGRPMPTVEVDGNHYIGKLEIHSLGLELPVLSEWSDTLLKLVPVSYFEQPVCDMPKIAAISDWFRSASSRKSLIREYINISTPSQYYTLIK